MRQRISERALMTCQALAHGLALVGKKKHATQPVAVMSEEVLQLATRTYLVLLVQASQIIIALFRALFA